MADQKEFINCCRTLLAVRIRSPVCSPEQVSLYIFVRKAGANACVLAARGSAVSVHHQQNYAVLPAGHRGCRAPARSCATRCCDTNRVFSHSLRARVGHVLGTHDWEKFPTVSEVTRMCEGVRAGVGSSCPPRSFVSRASVVQAGLRLEGVGGMVFNPLSQQWTLTGESWTDVNYILHASV